MTQLGNPLASHNPLSAGAPALHGSLPAAPVNASGGTATTDGIQQAQQHLDPQPPMPAGPAPVPAPPPQAAMSQPPAPPVPQPAPTVAPPPAQIPTIGNPGSGWIGNPLAPDGEGPVTAQVPKLAESLLEGRPSVLGGLCVPAGLLTLPRELAGRCGAQIKAAEPGYDWQPPQIEEPAPEPVKVGSSGCSCGGYCRPCAEKMIKAAMNDCYAHGCTKTADGSCSCKGRCKVCARSKQAGLASLAGAAVGRGLSQLVQSLSPETRAALVAHLWPVAAGGLGGAAYGAYKAPGGSSLRGALIGGMGGAAGGAAFSGGNALLQSNQGKSLNETTVGNTALLGATGLGLHGGLSLGRHMADKLELGRKDNESDNDLREIDVMDKRHGLLSDLFGKRAIAGQKSELSAALLGPVGGFLASPGHRAEGAGRGLLLNPLTAYGGLLGGLAGANLGGVAAHSAHASPQTLALATALGAATGGLGGSVLGYQGGKAMMGPASWDKPPAPTMTKDEHDEWMRASDWMRSPERRALTESQMLEDWQTHKDGGGPHETRAWDAFVARHARQKRSALKSGYYRKTSAVDVKGLLGAGKELLRGTAQSAKNTVKQAPGFAKQWATNALPQTAGVAPSITQGLKNLPGAALSSGVQGAKQLGGTAIGAASGLGAGAYADQTAEDLFPGKVPQGTGKILGMIGGGLLGGRRPGALKAMIPAGVMGGTGALRVDKWKQNVADLRQTAAQEAAGVHQHIEQAAGRVPGLVQSAIEAERARILPEGMDPETLKSLLTRAQRVGNTGGEAVDWLKSQWGGLTPDVQRALMGAGGGLALGGLLGGGRGALLGGAAGAGLGYGSRQLGFAPEWNKAPQVTMSPAGQVAPATPTDYVRQSLSDPTPVTARGPHWLPTSGAVFQGMNPPPSYVLQ